MARIWHGYCDPFRPPFAGPSVFQIWQPPLRRRSPRMAWCRGVVAADVCCRCCCQLTRIATQPGPNGMWCISVSPIPGRAAGTASGHLLGRAPLGLFRVFRGGKGLPRGSIEMSPCHPGGSGVGLCLPGEEMTPFASPISEGGPGCGAAPREKADGFTDHDRCDRRTAVRLGKHACPGSGLRARPTYIPRPAARPSTPDASGTTRLTGQRPAANERTFYMAGDVITRSRRRCCCRLRA
jgi:hypothetical protein